MARKKLIQMYEDMMCRYGEYDVWQDDVEPKLSGMTVRQIRNQYEIDKVFYQAREAAGGQF